MNYLEIIVTWFCITIIVFSSAAYGQSAEELYQKGVQLEEIKGDLEKAIEAYGAVLKNASSAKKTAALAQLHLGLCYEKLGKNNLDKAIESFQKVIDNYPEQNELVKIARERLAANDTSNEDIEEIKKMIAAYNKAFELKDGDACFGFLSKKHLEKSLWGKFHGKDAKSEFIDWLNNTYFSKWKSLNVDYKIKSIEKIDFDYRVVQDWNLRVTDWSDREIILERGSDFITTVTKENGQWKHVDRLQVNQPEGYKNLKGFKEMGNPGLIYVSHITQCFVTVIDPAANKIVDQLLSHYGPTSVAFTPDNSTGYITNYLSNEVTVFEKSTYRETKNIPVGEHPSNSMVTPDGKYLLVMHESNDGMWIINRSDDQVTKKDLAINGNMELHPSQNKIYIAGIFKPMIYVFDPLDLKVIKEIPTGGRPMNIAISSDGKNAYIPNFDLNEVEVIDCKTDSVIHRIQDVQNPRGIALTRDNKYAYVTNVMTNTVTVIDLVNNSVIETIACGAMPTFAAISRDNKYAYITNQGSASVSVIDISKNEVVNTIEVADNPITVQVD